jgi:HK97 family phage prohead protease
MKKVLNLKIKSLGELGHGVFSGYGSTFGNVDRVGDIVERGAFERTLETHKKNGTMPAMLIHHDMTRPIGRWIDMREDEYGLNVEGKLTTGVRDADEAYALLKDGAINSMSIGYKVLREDYDHRTGINHLHEVELHELSLVTIPANAAAIVGAVKDAEGNPNIRELEAVLREAGLSRREAKAFLAEGFKALRPAEPEMDESPVMPEECVVTAARKSAIDEMLTKLGVS